MLQSATPTATGSGTCSAAASPSPTCSSSQQLNVTVGGFELPPTSLGLDITGIVAGGGSALLAVLCAAWIVVAALRQHRRQREVERKATVLELQDGIRKDAESTQRAMLAQARRASLRLSGAAEGTSVSTVVTRQRNSSADADAADMFPHGAYSRASAMELPSTQSRHRTGDSAIVTAASNSDDELLRSRPGSASSIRAMPLASLSMIQQWLDGKPPSTARLKSGCTSTFHRTNTRPPAPPLSMGARRGSWLTAASDADPGPVASEDLQPPASAFHASRAGTSGRSSPAAAAAAAARGEIPECGASDEAALQDAATLALAADLVRSAAEGGTMPSAADARAIAAEAGIVLRTDQLDAVGPDAYGSRGGGLRRASSDANVVAELFTHVAAAALAQLSSEGAPQPEDVSGGVYGLAAGMPVRGHPVGGGGFNAAQAPAATGTVEHRSTAEVPAASAWRDAPRGQNTTAQRVAEDARQGESACTGQAGDSFAALPVSLPSQVDTSRDGGSGYCTAAHTVALSRRNSLLRSHNPWDSSPRASAAAFGASNPPPLAASASVSPRALPRDGAHASRPPHFESVPPAWSAASATSGAPSSQPPDARLTGGADGAAMLGTAEHAAATSASPRTSAASRHAESPAWTPAASPRARGSRARDSSPAASLRAGARPSLATSSPSGQLPRSSTTGHIAAVRGSAGGSSPAPRLSAALTAALAMRPLRATPTAELWHSDVLSAYATSEDATSASPTATISAAERGRIRGGIGRRLHSVVIDMGQMDPMLGEPAHAVGGGSVFTSAGARALAPGIARPAAASPALPSSAEVSSATMGRDMSGVPLAHKSSAHWASLATLPATAAAPRRSPAAALALGMQIAAPGTQSAVDPPAAVTGSGSSLTAARAVSSMAIASHAGAAFGASGRGWVLRCVDSVTGPALSSSPLGLTAVEPQAALVGGRGDSVTRQRLSRRRSALAVSAAAAMIVRAGAGAGATNRGASVSPAPRGGGRTSTLPRRQTVAVGEFREAVGR